LPEGPEVRRLVDQLQDKVEGRVLNNITVISGRYLKTPIVGLSDVLADIKLSSSLSFIEEINCKGKFIWFKIRAAQHYWFLYCTLGLTGTFLLTPNKYERVRLALSQYKNRILLEGSFLYYCDMRSFGTVKAVKGEEALQKKLASLGPDMLSNPCTLQEWFRIMHKYKNKSIVSFLLEQKYISGIGNIYKSESLYLAKIDPRKKVNDLLDTELTRLYNAVKEVLTNAYELGGSTIRNYTDLYGNPGKYAERDKESYNHAQNKTYSTRKIMVYNQEIDPLGNKVKRLKLDDGRTTFFVPEIQI